MDWYFLIITILDIFVLGIMCILTRYNETLNKRQRQWFIHSFVLIIAISVLEVISVAVDRGPVGLRWINIAANYLGFGLTPVVPLFLACALEKNRSIKYAIIIEIAFLLFLAISLPFKLVFSVDQNNQYMREEFWGIYVAVYLAGILYLLGISLQVASKYQNKSKFIVYPITAFLLASTLIQIIFPQVHITWLCVSLLSILYFTYCNGMWQQLDGLTGLLNQKSYLNTTASLSQGGTLIVFDIDNFKQVNDTYGHLTGDQCLEIIAACMKKAYSRDGFCYRIGGDEFCVLLDAHADETTCYLNLLRELEHQRKTLPMLPYVAMGAASFQAGDNILDVKDAADHTMYQCKKAQKARRQNPEIASSPQARQ